MTHMILVRHGATEWNAAKRAQGQADIPLNEDGIRQAKETAERLAGSEIAAVYSSDLLRATATAARIAEAHDLEVRIDPAFREIDQGDWEGVETEQIRRRWPELWGDARHWKPRPNGESPAQVRARGLEGIRRIVEAHPEGTVVVVSHGGTIRWLSAEAMGYDDRASSRLRGVANGGAVALDARIDGGELVLENLVRHDGRATDLDDPND
jgi:alpha-ribazole phosphatase